MAALLVIDASAAIKAFVEEKDSAEARRLFAGGSVLVAPVHALGECAEVLVRKTAKSELNAGQAFEAIEFIKKSIGFIAIDDLIEIAVRIAIGAEVSVYDALYVATARMLGCNLVTADDRLIRKIGKTADAGILVPLRQVNS